jgi:hypothetical protein
VNEVALKTTLKPRKPLDGAFPIRYYCANHSALSY